MSHAAVVAVLGPDPLDTAVSAIRDPSVAPPLPPHASPTRAAPSSPTAAETSSSDASPSAASVIGSRVIDLSGGKSRVLYDADLDRIIAAWNDFHQPLGGGAEADAGEGPIHVHTLDFSVNRLTDKGVSALAQTLRRRPARLRTLELDGNDFGDRGAEEVALLFAPFEAPSGNGAPPRLMLSALTRLDLSCNRITDKGVHALVVALFDDGKGRGCAALRTLLLRSNSFGDNGAQRLFAFAEDPAVCRLTTLHVSGNTQCTEAMLPWLTQALRLNQTLTDLNIANTVPRISDLPAVRDAVRANSTLIALSMAFDGRAFKDAEVDAHLRRNRAIAAKRHDEVQRLKDQHQTVVAALQKEISDLKDQLADAHRKIAVAPRAD